MSGRVAFLVAVVCVVAACDRTGQAADTSAAIDSIGIAAPAVVTTPESTATHADTAPRARATTTQPPRDSTRLRDSAIVMPRTPRRFPPQDTTKPPTVLRDSAIPMKTPRRFPPVKDTARDTLRSTLR